MEERRGGAQVNRKGRGHSRRWWVTSMAARDVVMANMDKDTQAEGNGSAAPTGADRAAGQRDAGSTRARNLTWCRSTGRLGYCTGGVWRAVVRKRAAMPEALAGILSVGS